MTTKLTNIANRAKEDPKLRFTSLVHILDEDFLKQCYTDLKRNKAPGIDSVTVTEYGEKLEENIKGLVNGFLVSLDEIKVIDKSVLRLRLV